MPVGDEAPGEGRDVGLAAAAGRQNALVAECDIHDVSTRLAGSASLFPAVIAGLFQSARGGSIAVLHAKKQGRQAQGVPFDCGEANRVRSWVCCPHPAAYAARLAKANIERGTEYTESRRAGLLTGGSNGIGLQLTVPRIVPLVTPPAQQHQPPHPAALPRLSLLSQVRASRNAADREPSLRGQPRSTATGPGPSIAIAAASRHDAPAGADR